MTVDADSPGQPPRPAEKSELDTLFIELVQAHRPLVQRLCTKLLSDQEEAEDAAQQTFLLAYQSLLSGTRPRQPPAWLCAIARRECWARHGRSRRQRAVLQTAPPFELDPSDRAVLHAELATVMEGLSLLPPQQKQALLLYELGGLSYRQVAAELEITESAADALLIRARRTLRRGRLVLFPLPLSLPLPRPLQRLLRHAESTARACASVGAQATAAGATTLLLTATAALATTADQTHSSAQAVAAAPAESERAQPRDPIARRSSRPAAHPNAARPTGTHRHSGTRRVITAAVDVHPPTAAATPNDRMPESSKRSQPAPTIARTEVTPPARTVAPQDQHLAEAHPGDRAVAETQEAPNPTTTPPRTHPPTPSTSPQHDSATPPTTDPTTRAADPPAINPVLPAVPEEPAGTPNPPTDSAGIAPTPGNPSGSVPSDPRKHGEHGKRGTVDGTTPGADPAPPVPPKPIPQPPTVVPKPSPQPPIVVPKPSPPPPLVANPPTPGTQGPNKPDARDAPSPGDKGGSAEPRSGDDPGRQRRGASASESGH